MEKDISVFNKQPDQFKLKKIIQIMQKRNQLHEQFRQEFVDNFYPLKIGNFYDAPMGIYNCSNFFHKFFCLKKLGPAEYEVEALSEKNKLYHFSLKLKLGMDIFESEEQSFFPKNVLLMR